MDDKQLMAIVEGILFIWGEPLELEDLVKCLNMPAERIESTLEKLAYEAKIQQRGIQLQKYENAYQWVTIPEIHEYMENFIKKRPQHLSSSSMEVLSIIAYKQPITKVQIEEIRGVKSDSSIDTLMRKGLIETKGRLNQIGRPMLFGTTTTFLKYFNLNGLEELPPLRESQNETE